MLTAYRALGALVVVAVLATLGSGWAPGSTAEKIPEGARNSPGAYRSYFIVNGGK